jgi:hypothetical protein
MSTPRPQAGAVAGILRPFREARARDRGVVRRGEGGRDAGIVTCHSTVAGDVQTGSWAAVCTCNEWRLLELQITPRN